METFNLETSQNVALEYRVASLGDRILAYLLDSFFMGAYLTMLLVIFSNNIVDMGIWFALFLMPILFYHFLFEVFFNGQSPGKMIMKIKVVKTDGSQLSAGSCFIRWIFRIIDIALMMGGVAVIIMIFNGKGQRLGDIAASTTVLRVPSKGHFENTLWQDVEKGYVPKFLQVELLSDNDIQIVKEVLKEVAKRPESLKSQQLLQRTSEAIAKKTAVQSHLDDHVFLNTIVKDYNAIHRRETVNI